MPLPRAPRLFVVLMIAAISLVPGCADPFRETTLAPPTGPDAEVCLDRCNLRMDECQGRQDTRVQECQQILASAQTNYDLCIENNASNCTKPDQCAGPDMGICKQEYDTCFTACGGRIKTEWDAQPAQQPDDPAPATATESALDGPEHAEG